MVLEERMILLARHSLHITPDLEAKRPVITDPTEHEQFWAVCWLFNHKMIWPSSILSIRGLERSVTSDVLRVHQAMQLEVCLVREKEPLEFLICQSYDPLTESQSHGSISRLELLASHRLEGVVPKINICQQTRATSKSRVLRI